jgi:transcriptional regulator with XRE-family HTH domain
MARTYLAEVEAGKRNVSVINLERIATGLGVTLGEFFSSSPFEGK